MISAGYDLTPKSVIIRKILHALALFPYPIDLSLKNES
jgi:hypothetical protein